MGGRGEGDPRETTECKQVVEEEVRRGGRRSGTTRSPLIQKDLVKTASSPKAAEQEEKEDGQQSSTKQVHNKYSRLSDINAQLKVERCFICFYSCCVVLNCMKIENHFQSSCNAQKHAVIFSMQPSSGDTRGFLVFTAKFQIVSTVSNVKNPLSLI